MTASLKIRRPLQGGLAKLIERAYKRVLVSGPSGLIVTTITCWMRLQTGSFSFFLPTTYSRSMTPYSLVSAANGPESGANGTRSEPAQRVYSPHDFLERICSSSRPLRRNGK